MGKKLLCFRQGLPNNKKTKRGPKAITSFSAKIELSDEDIVEINSRIGLSLPREIILDLKFERPKILGDRDMFNGIRNCAHIPKDKIRDFIGWFSDNFNFIYIPANRSVNDFRRSIYSELISNAIQNDKKAKKHIAQIQKDIDAPLKKLEEDLKTHLQKSLRDLTGISLLTSEPDILDIVSLKDVEITDGAKTSLSQKGDGVKSIFIMSLLQFLAKQKLSKNLVFAIEEPEAHLHASAIYDTKTNLNSLSKSFQVLISTHSPILIQRESIKSNIIIDCANKKPFSCFSHPANNLSEIAKSLGIKPQDNLTSAELTILVEGETENNCIGLLIASICPSLKTAFEQGRIKVLNAQGASKVLNFLKALARDTAECIIILDSDNEGLQAARTIKDSGLICTKDIFTVPTRDGCQETEFEDIFDPTLYINEISSSINRTFSIEDFQKKRNASGNSKNKTKKWSDVMSRLIKDVGAEWEDVEKEVKTAFANAIRKSLATTTYNHNLWLKSIANCAESKLKEFRSSST